jgi:hypothetical protein
MKIVLIGGTGRCGTNILKDTLSLHDMVFALPFECRFLTDPDGIVDSYLTIINNWSPYIVNNKIWRLKEFFNKLIGHPHRNPYYGWEIEKWFENIEEKLKIMYDDLISFTYESTFDGKVENKTYYVRYNDFNIIKIFREFLYSIINEKLIKESKTVFVDDNTWNTLFACELHKIIPDAYFINIFRNEKDVISSMLDQRWTPSNIVELKKYYNDLHLKIENSLKSLPKKNYINIRFEDLVIYPEKTLKNICNFIKIPYYPKLLKGNLNINNAHIGRSGSLSIE